MPFINVFYLFIESETCCKLCPLCVVDEEAVRPEEEAAGNVCRGGGA